MPAIDTGRKKDAAPRFPDDAAMAKRPRKQSWLETVQAIQVELDREIIAWLVRNQGRSEARIKDSVDAIKEDASSVLMGRLHLDAFEEDGTPVTGHDFDRLQALVFTEGDRGNALHGCEVGRKKTVKPLKAAMKDATLAIEAALVRVTVCGLPRTLVTRRMPTTADGLETVCTRAKRQLERRKDRLGGEKAEPILDALGKSAADLAKLREAVEDADADEAVVGSELAATHALIAEQLQFLAGWGQDISRKRPELRDYFAMKAVAKERASRKSEWASRRGSDQGTAGTGDKGNPSVR